MDRRQSQLALDCFLLNLLSHHQDQTPLPVRHEETGPEWLTAAIQKMTLPENLHKSPADFAAFCYRSHEHVARVLKECQGITPTALIHHLRLDFAAKRLLLSDDEILDIAADSGYSSLSNFYQKFKERFGETPRRYRLKQQTVLKGS